MRRVMQGDPPDRLVARARGRGGKGFLRRKRVSAALRECCPVEAQTAYFTGGLVSLIKWYQDNGANSLQDAVNMALLARGFSFNATMDKWGNLNAQG